MSIFKRLENLDVFTLPWECWVFLFRNCLFNLGENQSSSKRSINYSLIDVTLFSCNCFLTATCKYQVICQTNTVVLFLSFSHAIVPKVKPFGAFYMCILYEECRDLGDFANFQHKTKNISPICFFSSECRCRYAAVLSWGTECRQILSMTKSKTPFRKFKNVLPWFGGGKERNLDLKKKVALNFCPKSTMSIPRIHA